MILVLNDFARLHYVFTTYLLHVYADDIMAVSQNWVQSFRIFLTSFSVNMIFDRGYHF